MSGLDKGSTLGGYEILARLRAGAMGTLYLARRQGSAGFARPVAIKVIHDHLAQNERFRRMFIAEAKLSARIDDPHVVRVEEFGEAEGRHYLVMEYVHGASLAQTLGIMRSRGGIPLDVAVAIAMDIASGLHAAHEATDEAGQSLGIVHRDVSPHNVLVSYNGYVKVIDFGIAKAKESVGQTLTGSIRGKLAYMPPEQARSAKHVDRRADLYALGLVLWEMLAGRRLFDGKNDIELLNQIKNAAIVRPSEIDARVPKELDDVVMVLLEQDPKKRPPTAATVARMLATARPAAAKVLAADIAAVMEKVRQAATEPSTSDDPDDRSSIYGEEVKKGIAVFRLDVPKDEEETGQEETAVMLKAPVERAQEAPSAVVDEEETTHRVHPTHARRNPRPTANQAKTIPLNSQAQAQAQPQPTPPPIAEPAAAPPSPPPAAGVGSMAMPEWVTPPVMVLAATTAALAVALVVVQCGSRSHPAAVAATPMTEPVPSAFAPAPSGSAFEQAQKAALDGNPALVRQLLENKVLSGRATPEEARLVRAACKQLGDVTCANAVKAKYP